MPQQQASGKEAKIGSQMRLVRVVLIASMLSFAGCDGPQEQAGEKADVASGAIDRASFLESGPAETLGERADEAAASAHDAAEARADLLEKQADAERDVAARTAEALEQEADKIRQNERE